MKEDLLHYIWQSRRLLASPLTTTAGLPIEVIHPGIHNGDAGPDFFNAKVKIGDTVWAGNIEIHIQASDWNAHKHQHDVNYDNVILHVVYIADKEAHYTNGNVLPTLELKSILPPYLLKRYDLLHKQQSKIPCEAIMQLPDTLKLDMWLTRLLTERLETKSERLQILLNQLEQHWEEAFYIFTARYFGMKTNSEPMEWLARRVPMRILARHKNNLHQLRAILFGVSGLIGQKGLDRLDELKAEADALIHKYSLQPLQPQSWKFARTRPANFPDVRLDQLALFIHHASHLFSKTLSARDVQSLTALYSLKENNKLVLSKSTLNLLLINAVLPAIFTYGKKMNQPELSERAIQFYESLPAETNGITSYWSKKGVEIKSAAQSQAILQLNSAYCEQVKCLQCAIGHHSLWQ
jgi:hypothetical protein